MTAPARRPWWRKKRWVAGLAVWLVGYVLSLGAAEYAHGRRWIPKEAFPVFKVVYYPLRWLAGCDVSPEDCLRWCYEKGAEDRVGSDRSAGP